MIVYYYNWMAFFLILCLPWVFNCVLIRIFLNCLLYIIDLYFKFCYWCSVYDFLYKCSDYYVIYTTFCSLWFYSTLNKWDVSTYLDTHFTDILGIYTYCTKSATFLVISLFNWSIKVQFMTLDILLYSDFLCSGQFDDSWDCPNQPI